MASVRTVIEAYPKALALCLGLPLTEQLKMPGRAGRRGPGRLVLCGWGTKNHRADICHCQTSSDLTDLTKGQSLLDTQVDDLSTKGQPDILRKTDGRGFAHLQFARLRTARVLVGSLGHQNSGSKSYIGITTRPETAVGGIGNFAKFFNGGKPFVDDSRLRLLGRGKLPTLFTATAVAAMIMSIYIYICNPPPFKTYLLSANHSLRSGFD